MTLGLGPLASNPFDTLGTQFVLDVGGIASAEAIGTATVTQSTAGITDAGNIASVEAVGTATIIDVLTAGNIQSAESFGVVNINRSVNDVGNIASGEAFGTANVIYNRTITDVGGVQSSEAFGTCTVSQASQRIEQQRRRVYGGSSRRELDDIIERTALTIEARFIDHNGLNEGAFVAGRLRTALVKYENEPRVKCKLIQTSVAPEPSFDDLDRDGGTRVTGGFVGSRFKQSA